MKDQSAETAILLGTGMTLGMADTGEALTKELHDTYSRPLFRFAFAITGSADDAEDAVQVVFVRLLQEPKRLARIRNVKAYLYSAVRNGALNILRSKRRKEALQESLRAESQAEGHAQVESQLLCEALEDLPVDQREVMILKIYDEMTFKEIADTVGASINTVASRYRYGIEKLREALEVSEND